ncbi:AaceriAEL174Wp [[Ashbya] aceris (nom. inval.)]|nr:AaceriAEL174Wp [[Ashbya] aceris (nom. inval.)]
MIGDIQLQETQQGVVHGHIHNYNNLTYIHGHVHNNSRGSDGEERAQPQHESVMAAMPATRRDIDCSKYQDCQHFEFVNYHNLNLFQEAQGEGSGIASGTRGWQDDLLLPQPGAKRSKGTCTQCSPKIMEICCEQQHVAGGEGPSDIAVFHGCPPGEWGGEERSGTVVNLPKFINCDFTCPSGTAMSHMDSSSSTLTVETSTADAASLEDGTFDWLCQQCVNYDSCEDTAGHEQQHCHDHVVNSETDIKILNDLVSISSMYEAPLCKNADQSINLLHSSISGIADTGAAVGSNSPTPTAPAVPQGRAHYHHHHHHHHHRIELHPHKSLEGALAKAKEKFTSNERDSVPEDSPAEQRRCLSTNGTNTINFNWSFKSNDRTLRCLWDDCSTVHPNLLDLQSHMLKDHISSTTVEADFPCRWKDCDFLSTDTDSLINHVNGAHGIGFDIQFLDEKALQLQNCNHCESHCSSNAIEPSADGTFRCLWDTCTDCFSTRQALNDHIVSSHVPSGRSAYQCNWAGCAKHFTQRQKLLRHIKVHTGHKPCSCPHCPKTFSTDDILAQHIRTHSGERPFHCHYCRKQFSTSSSLRVHIRTHTGEKPLSCAVCGKRFNESSNLSKHMKIHERKYMCKLCKRSFDRLPQYNSHVAKCARLRLAKPSIERL